MADQLTSAYFDCQFGAAGDMLLGALIDAGLDLKAWQNELDKIALPKGSFAIRTSTVVRATMAAIKLDVDIADHEHSHDHDHGHDDEHAHEHAHEHIHKDAHGREHRYVHSHTHTHVHDAKPLTGHLPTFPSASDHSHAHTRKLAEVLQIIADSAITEAAKDLAARIFQRLAKAEGLVHGVSPFEVHFHEVGAVDAIIDIVGFAVAYDMLKIKKSYASAVPLGSGQVKTAHGLFPVPAPATVRLLQEAKATTSALHIPYECLTPTGAAILCEVAHAWGKQPAFNTISATGCGAGTKDNPDLPNLCRVIIGQESIATKESAKSERFAQERVVQLEANIDDLSPQVLSFACDKLLNEGALDVSLTPTLMKKGRPGQILSVLSKPSDQERLQEIILQETSSLGVRAQALTRIVAEREWQKVTLGSGDSVRIKIALDKAGNIINLLPEFEDCAAHANKTGQPVKNIINEALTLYRTQTKSD